MCRRFYILVLGLTVVTVNLFQLHPDSSNSLSKQPEQLIVEQEETMVNILNWERSLYGKMSVADKYDVLERMRLELDRLYRDDRETYERCRQQLRANTWNALEDAWKLWDPVPKSNAAWSGPGNRTCSLKDSYKPGV